MPRPGRPALEALRGRRIGPHLPLGMGMIRAAERAQSIGATTVQIFADNPTAWRRRREPPGQLGAFRARLEELDIRPLAIHGPYLVNLAGPDRTFWDRSVETLVADLLHARAYGALAVTVHAGSHRGSGGAAGIRRLADGIAAVERRLATESDLPRIVLENSAGGRDSVGSTLEELADILEAVVGRGVPASRVGFCLDTAHLWAAGHDLRDAAVVERLLVRFDALLGAEQLMIVHLNDSRAALGSRSDRHQHLGAGSIGADAMRHLVLHPRLAQVPMFFETPGMDEGYDALNMERVRRLIAGDALSQLDERDLALPGSRRHRRGGTRTSEASRH